MTVTQTPQFTLYSHVWAPNGWKVAYVLNELALPYKTVYLDFHSGEHKAPKFLEVNPNGRIPALVDHTNNDYVVWESAAILLYLVDKYDKEKRLTVMEDEDRHRLYTWLFFQMSGHGPHFGQEFWFILLSDKVNVQECYRAESRRVLDVLERVLSKQEWLVGGKMTIADISFVPWNAVHMKLLGEDFDLKQEFPATHRWHTKLMALPGVKTGLEERAHRLALSPIKYGSYTPYKPVTQVGEGDIRRSM